MASRVQITSNLTDVESAATPLTTRLSDGAPTTQTATASQRAKGMGND